MALVKAVQDVEVRISQEEKQQRTREQQYNLSKPDRTLSLPDFLALPHDLNIEVAINAKTKELLFASQVDKPRELTFRNHEFSAARDILSRNFSTIHKEAASKIAAHVKHISSDTGLDYNFLQTGFALHAHSSNLCPLCGQDTASVDELFRAYAAYFDMQYKTHQDNVRSLQTKVQRWNVEHEFDTLSSEAASWAAYFSDQTIHERFIEQTDELRKKVVVAKEQFETICSKKIEEPTVQVDISSVDKLEQLWTTLAEVVNEFNTRISSFVQQVGTKNKRQIESELSLLNAQKLRHEQKWSEFCNTYEESRKSIESFKQARDVALQNLSTYSATVFAAHQRGINEVLELVGADFRVHDLGEKKDLRKSQAVYCGFELKFFGQHVVPLSGNTQDASFNNTLSGGDRSALAFAFFVSMLRNTQDLANTIVVFDDPIF
jgi:wobble nucleotide-excising tRNase